jgi:hypothetical protein
MVHRAVATLFISYLFLSVCFGEPAQAVLTNNAAKIKGLPNVSQIVIAAIAKVDSSTSSSALSGFSQAVSDLIKGSRQVDVSAVAPALIALTTIDILLRLEALTTLSPSLAQAIQAKSAVFASSLNSFFSKIDAVAPGTKALLDIRALSTLGAALDLAGAPKDAASVDLALLVALSLTFNVAFQSLLTDLNAELAQEVTDTFGYIWAPLSSFSTSIFAVASDIISLLGGTTSTAQITISRPLPAPIVRALFASFNSAIPNSLLNQLSPLKGSFLPVSAPALLGASNLWAVLNTIQ